MTQKHTAKVVKQWFKDNNISVLDWPPQSPDLNPIDNLWEIVNRRINRDGMRNKDQLFAEIQTAWAAIPQNIIDNLIQSMPQRDSQRNIENGEEVGDPYMKLHLFYLEDNPSSTFCFWQVYITIGIAKILPKKRRRWSL